MPHCLLVSTVRKVGKQVTWKDTYNTIGKIEYDSRVAARKQGKQRRVSVQCSHTNLTKSLVVYRHVCFDRQQRTRNKKFGPTNKNASQLFVHSIQYKQWDGWVSPNGGLGKQWDQKQPYLATVINRAHFFLSFFFF